MNTARVLFLLAALTGSGFLQAQTLPLEEAIKKSLSQNLNIQLTDQSIAIAEEQNSIGNAGMLPTIDLNAGGSYSNSNAELTILGLPEPLNVTGAQATALNTSLNLNYVLFNGFAAQSTYKKFGIALDLANTQKRMAVEGTILQVIASYFQVASLQKNDAVLAESIAISKDRLDRAKVRYDYGGNKVDLLSAEVDYARDSINFLNNRVALSAAQKNLSFLMGDQEFTSSYEVEEEVAFLETLNLEELWKNAEGSNAAFQNAQQSILLAEQDAKLSRSGAFPTISLNSSYSFSQSENEASQLQKAVNNGFSAGLSLNYRLYGGGQRRSQSKMAAINLKSQLLNKENQERLLRKDLEVAYSEYITKWKVVAMEEKNIKTAELNFQRSKELFNLGKLTNTQFREAQLNLTRSRILLSQSKYELKISESNLLQLSGSLLSN